MMRHWLFPTEAMNIELDDDLEERSLIPNHDQIFFPPSIRLTLELTGEPPCATSNDDNIARGEAG